MSGQLLLCKNNRCSAVVPPSKNPGRPRVFCTNRCARRYHARMAYQREAGGRGDGMMFVNDFGHPQVKRVMPQSAKLAKQRFTEHLHDCAVSTTGGLCPAYYDPYDKKALCLIHAVLNEDWEQLMKAESGLSFERKVTSADGRWLTDNEREQAVVRAALDGAQTGATVATKTREQVLQEFVDAGGAKPKNPADIYMDVTPSAPRAG